MKPIINYVFIIVTVILFSACGNQSSSSSSVTANSNATFKVWGNCEMCKETIEGSLKKDGIAKADWNTDTKMMQVSFDSTKINLDQIEKNIASVGYDNEKYKGDDAKYSELPECCQYKRK